MSLSSSATIKVSDLADAIEGKINDIVDTKIAESVGEAITYINQ